LPQSPPKLSFEVWSAGTERQQKSVLQAENEKSPIRQTSG
jgi:hypothetical protein